MSRDEWVGTSLAAWLHPGDWPELCRLGKQMGFGPATARLRLGKWRRWATCDVECSEWTLDGASIAVTSLPPPESVGLVVARGSIYEHVDAMAEELLEATAWELRGTDWRKRVHPIDVAQNVDLVHRVMYEGQPITSHPVVIRTPDRWKLVKTWSDPGDETGVCVSRFCEIDPCDVLGRPLESMVSTGMAPYASATHARSRSRN